MDLTNSSPLYKNPIILLIGGLLGVGLIIVGFYLQTYSDYKSHKKPLQQADPFLASTYTYWHHLRVVALPLLKYRLSITVEKKDGTHRPMAAH